MTQNSDWMGRLLHDYDDDLPLLDALDDRSLPAVWRALAALAIGREVNDAYYAVVDLRDAAELAAIEPVASRGRAGSLGMRMLGHILDQPCDHYQRAVWYALADRSLDEAVDALRWFAGVLETRGRVAGLADRSGRPIVRRVGLPKGRPSRVEPVEVILNSGDPREETEE